MNDDCKLGGVHAFQSPEGEVLTVQQIAHVIQLPLPPSFQSPEGEVLTVQHRWRRVFIQRPHSFSPPKGKC